LINPWIWGTLVWDNPFQVYLCIFIYIYIYIICIVYSTMDVHASWKPPTRTIKRNKAKTLRKCSEANGIAAKSGIRAPNQPFQTPANSVIHSPSGSKTVRTFRESMKHHDNAHMEINGWLVHKNEQVIHCFPFVHDFSLRMGDYVQFPLPVLDS
jgi:hypothetical protein